MVLQLVHSLVRGGLKSCEALHVVCYVVDRLLGLVVGRRRPVELLFVCVLLICVAEGLYTLTAVGVNVDELRLGDLLRDLVGVVLLWRRPLLRLLLVLQTLVH